MPSFKIIGLLVLEKKIVKVFIIYGHGGHLGNVTRTIYIYCCSIFRRRSHIKFGFDWPSGCERYLKMMDGRTLEQWYTISSPCEQESSCKLIIGGKDPPKLIERTLGRNDQVRNDPDRNDQFTYARRSCQ